jgi:colanic acid biosynthesis glycosyl transferase WcaI
MSPSFKKSVDAQFDSTVSMELLFINRFFFPDNAATSQLLSDLSFDLADAGHRVQVITSRRSYSHADQSYLERENIKGVDIHRVLTTNFGRHGVLGKLIDFLSFYIFATVALIRLSHAGMIVIVKTDPPLFSFAVNLISRFKRFRYINWLQDIYPDIAVRKGMGWGFSLLIPFLNRARNSSLRGAWLNVAIGDRMKEMLMSWQVPPESIRVIPNWSDVNEPHSSKAGQTALRRDWGLDDKFVVMYSGNLGFAHDADAIATTVHRLQDEGNIAFLFVGGGVGLASLKAKLAQSPSKNVLFKPYVPRELLTDSLSLADVHLVSLRPEMEGLIVPSKVYGVMGVGRPFVFIGSPEGEVGQLILKHQVGTVASPKRADAISEAILHYRSHPDLGVQHGANGSALFERCFRKDRVLESWREVFSANGPSH